MKTEIVEGTMVFLVPLFAATMINNFGKKKVRANLKVVFYKFFMLCAILFFASQIQLDASNSKMGTVVRIVGDILMAALIFEFFLIPGKDTHPDDVVLVHNFVLWLVVFLFLASCVMQHYPSISVAENGWNLHPVYKILDISKKVFDERALPTAESKSLPICNIFSYVKSTESQS